MSRRARTAVVQSTVTLLVVLAVGLVPAEAGCRCASGKKQAGGVMAGTSVEQLKHGEVGTMKAEGFTTDFIDPVPIVLWSGSNPAAVVTLREESIEALNRAKQTFALVHGKGSPFPISEGFSLDDTKAPRDAFNLGHIYTADVDGDGVEELVLVRENGAVEVHGLKRTLFKHHLPVKKKVYYYEAEGAHRAREGGRDVLFLIFVRSDDGDVQGAAGRLPDRSVVLRVDGKGITQLPLGELTRSRTVLGVGAVSRAGSQGIDELLVIAKGEEDAFLSRHRPGGEPIGAQRKIYAPLDGSSFIDFTFLPGSGRVVAFGTEKAYFIEAEKPVNWFHAVDLELLREKGESRVLGAVDPGAPKAIVSVKEELYAVDRDGNYFGWNGGFVPVKGVAPFLKLSPRSAEESLIGVYMPDGGGEEILAVYSRERQLKKLSFDETLAAARRFLPQDRLARREAALEPKLEGKDPVRDGEMEREQRAKGIEQRPTTVEEWKRTLPQSYEAVRQEERTSFLVYVMGDLEEGASPSPLGDYPDIKGLKAFLGGLELSAETRFELFRRGNRIAEGLVPSCFDGGGESRVQRREVAFRANGTAATVILALKPTGSEQGERATLSIVRLAETR